MAIIEGNWETREVMMDGNPLDPKPSQKVWNHSPDGFNWGYSGSGPAQLALAILMKYVDADRAVRLHQDFKFKFIATLPQKDFMVTLDVEEWIKQQKQ